LLQNGANPDDIVFTRQNLIAKEWGQSALWECASKGYIKLLQFMLNARIKVPKNQHKKWSLLHMASFYDKVFRRNINRGAVINIDIDIRDESTNTLLHVAAESGSVDIIKFYWIKECLLT